MTDIHTYQGSARDVEEPCSVRDIFFYRCVHFIHTRLWAEGQRSFIARADAVTCAGVVIFSVHVVDIFSKNMND